MFFESGGVPDSILQVTRRLRVGDDGWLRYQSVEKISENSNVIRFRRRKLCKKSKKLRPALLAA